MDVFLGLVFWAGIAIGAWYLFRLKGKSNTEIEFKGNRVDRAIKDSESLISTNVKKAKKFVQKSISKSYLTGCSWVLINENEKNVNYIFRANDELLVTTNGKVSKETYELLIDHNSILITKDGATELFNVVNIQDDFLYLNKSSTDSIQIFANQTKFKDVLKSEIRAMAKDNYNGNYKIDF